MGRERGERLLESFISQNLRIVADILRPTVLTCGNVNQHVGSAKKFTGFADDWRWKRLEVDADPVWTFSNRGYSANGSLRFDRNGHWASMVRKEVTLVGVELPGDAPAISWNCWLPSRKMDASLIKISNEAPDISDIDGYGKKDRALAIGPGRPFL